VDLRPRVRGGELVPDEGEAGDFVDLPVAGEGGWGGGGGRGEGERGEVRG